MSRFHWLSLSQFKLINTRSLSLSFSISLFLSLSLSLSLHFSSRMDILFLSLPKTSDNFPFHSLFLSDSLSLMHAQTETHTNTHTRTHSHSHTLTLAHAHINTGAHSHSHTLTLTDLYTIVCNNFSLRPSEASSLTPMFSCSLALWLSRYLIPHTNNIPSRIQAHTLSFSLSHPHHLCSHLLHSPLSP